MKTAPVPMKVSVRAEAGVTRLDVYDDIGDGGWYGDGLTAKDFSTQIAGIRGPLDVHINSGGGNVDDGIAIANAVRSYQGRKRTVVDGVAASIASIIMQAGDERIMQPGAMMMIHDASAGDYGNAANKRKLADLLDKYSDNLAREYATRAGGTPEQWREAMMEERWYTADEAVAAGLADRVGVGAAAIPKSFDLAAFHAVPGRIVAHLRSMPVLEPRNATESAGHGAFTGTHTHAHHSHDGPDGDGDGFHGHEHTHAGEDHHQHSHDGMDAAEGADGSTGVYGHTHGAVRAAYQPQPYEREDWENTLCPVCGKYSDQDAQYCGQCGVMLAGRDDVHGAPSQPDDGDDMSAKRTGGVVMNGPEGSTITIDLSGTYDPEPFLATLRQLVRDAAVDESDWDGPHAMSLAAKSDDPAATYKQICAGRRDGDPSKQDSWALPYKYPGKPVNRAGVKAALSRLPQTQGLTNETEAKALLQRLMKQANPDYQPEDHAALPGWLTDHHDTAPVPAWLSNTPEEATQ